MHRQAGIEVLNPRVLADARTLKVAGDVNAVLPLGIAGIALNDCGAPLLHAGHLPGAVGIGALAVGNVKYHLQQTLLQMMLESEEPAFLDFRHAFERAHLIV